MKQKRKFLAFYDYGQGGIWIYLFARTMDEIKEKYPELQVITKVPAFLATHPITASMTFDIDDEPKGWLEVLVRARK